MFCNTLLILLSLKPIVEFIYVHAFRPSTKAHLSVTSFRSTTLISTFQYSLWFTVIINSGKLIHWNQSWENPLVHNLRLCDCALATDYKARSFSDFDLNFLKIIHMLCGGRQQGKEWKASHRWLLGDWKMAADEKHLRRFPPVDGVTDTCMCAFTHKHTCVCNANMCFLWWTHQEAS